jgi:hypothetical protein
VTRIPVNLIAVGVGSLLGMGLSAWLLARSQR